MEEDPDKLVEGESIEVDSVAPEWQTWTDEGGDTAYVAELGAGRRAETVIVYGSASAAELQRVMELLTTEPVDG